MILLVLQNNCQIFFYIFIKQCLCFVGGVHAVREHHSPFSGGYELQGASAVRVYSAEARRLPGEVAAMRE